MGETENNPGISIIGTGALGRTLTRALHKNGFRIKSLWNRTEHAAKTLTGSLDQDTDTDTDAINYGSFPGSSEEIGEILFLTVSDGAIEQVAGRLAECFPDLSGKIIAHCSGNETSEILNKVKENGAAVAAFHPLQTFNMQSNASAFEDIYISLEGEGRAVEELSGIAERLGSKVLSIDPEAKPYLHAGAVVASNYLVTLMDMAGEIAALSSGINREATRKALLPLVRTTLENLSESSPPDVLSGPIARGDISTVCKHLKILEHNPRFKVLYRQLGLETLRLAKQKGSISPKEFEELEQLLSESD